MTKLPWLQEGYLNWFEFLLANIPPISIGMDKVEALLEEQSSQYPKISPWLPEDKHYLTQSEQWKIMRAIEQNPMAKLFHTHDLLGAIEKAFFITENGYIGTASHSIAAGDQIVLLSGLSVPIVLRERDDDRTYRLMGPALYAWRYVWRSVERDEYRIGRIHDPLDRILYPRAKWRKSEVYRSYINLKDIFGENRLGHAVSIANSIFIDLQFSESSCFEAMERLIWYYSDISNYFHKLHISSQSRSDLLFHLHSNSQPQRLPPSPTLQIQIRRLP